MSYKKARFHVETGPESLFRRVHQKMDGYRVLPHASRPMEKRWAERGIPTGLLRGFDTADWELMSAEVRTDRGKFVASAWRRPANGSWLWVVIGMNDAIEKAMFKQGRGASSDVVTEGDLYDFVDDVNTELTENESWRDDWQGAGDVTAGD